MAESYEEMTWKVPDAWTLEDAATVPIAYATAAYGLYICGNMKKGDKVLIHAGSGGVGMAAIQLALAEGCEVFTTVGTPEKRRFIKQTFPSIDDNHIGSSRNTLFEQLIMKQTNGSGVNIVLNSLAEDKLHASLRCLAKRGYFVEIGKYDILANSRLSMYVFRNEITFKPVMLDSISAEQAPELQEICKLMKICLDSGKIKPLPRKTFPREEIETAMRYMAAGKHIGKVLLRVCKEDSIDKPIAAHPRFHAKPDKNYIIFGGLGGLGLEVACWLCREGALHLVLVSRSGVKSGFQRMRVERLKSQGVDVQVISGRDASTPGDCEFILKTAEKRAPVDGIFNLAAVLNDALLVNQTYGTFEATVKPKAWLTRHLDALTRRICPTLRYFVVFSSSNCGRGLPGLSNYGFGNSVMERICEKRVAEGLPGLAIQWGPIDAVGIVEDRRKDNKRVDTRGAELQNLRSCMVQLARFMVQDQAVVSSVVVAEKSADQKVMESPADVVLKILGMKTLKFVNKESPLVEYGLDSLLTTEVKEALERNFDLSLTASQIRNLNFAKLISMGDSQTKENNTVQESK